MKSFEEFQMATAEEYGQKAEEVVKEILADSSLDTKEEIIAAIILSSGILTDVRLGQYHKWMNEV